MSFPSSNETYIILKDLCFENIGYLQRSKNWTTIKLVTDDTACYHKNNSVITGKCSTTGPIAVSYHLRHLERQTTNTNTQKMRVFRFNLHVQIGSLSRFIYRESWQKAKTLETSFFLFFFWGFFFFAKIILLETTH